MGTLLRRLPFCSAGGGTQHPPRTGAEQIGHETRELEVRFFKETLEPVLELDPITCQLVLATRHRPPEALPSDPAQSSG